MSLLLCRQEHVKRPYFVEAMGVHLYSSQELSYVIFNHPLLVLDDFIDERLLTFLREELNQGFLALKLERWMKNGDNPDEALLIILQECDYYSMSEVGRFRQMAAALRKKHPADFKRMKADELFSFRFGPLPYRTLDFQFETLPQDVFQSHGTVNYTVDQDYTRITEFKHLTGQKLPGVTTIVKEYSRAYTGAEGETPYYAIINPENNALYAKYKAEADKKPQLHLLGRLAEYKYYNMDAIATRALELAERL